MRSPLALSFPLSLLFSPVHVSRRLRRYFARPMGHPIGRNTALVSVFDERGPDGAKDNDDEDSGGGRGRSERTTEGPVSGKVNHPWRGCSFEQNLSRGQSGRVKPACLNGTRRSPTIGRV